MHCARTISFTLAAMLAVTIGSASLSAEKGVRLKSPASTHSDHVLMVPLDAMMTPPIFSISWWSRVKPTSNVSPPSYVFREAERNDARYRPGAE